MCLSRHEKTPESYDWPIQYPCDGCQLGRVHDESFEFLLLPYRAMGYYLEELVTFLYGNARESDLRPLILPYIVPLPPPHILGNGRIAADRVGTRIMHKQPCSPTR